VIADLIPVILETRIEKRKVSRTEQNRRYRHKHNAKYNAYRRAWWARRKNEAR